MNFKIEQIALFALILLGVYFFYQALNPVQPPPGDLVNEVSSPFQTPREQNAAKVLSESANSPNPREVSEKTEDNSIDLTQFFIPKSAHSASKAVPRFFFDDKKAVKFTLPVKSALIEGVIEWDQTYIYLRYLADSRSPILRRYEAEMDLRGAPLSGKGRIIAPRRLKPNYSKYPVKTHFAFDGYKIYNDETSIKNDLSARSAIGYVGVDLIQKSWTNPVTGEKFESQLVLSIQDAACMMRRWFFVVDTGIIREEILRNMQQVCRDSKTPIRDKTRMIFPRFEQEVVFTRTSKGFEVLGKKKEPLPIYKLPNPYSNNDLHQWLTLAQWDLGKKNFTSERFYFKGSELDMRLLPYRNTSVGEQHRQTLANRLGQCSSKFLVKKMQNMGTERFLNLLFSPQRPCRER